MINPFSPTSWLTAILKFFLAEPAKYFMHKMADVFLSSTAPDFGQVWWQSKYNSVTLVADVVAVLLLVLATTWSAARNRSATWHGPLISAGVVGFAIPAAPYAMAGLVALVDWACALVAADAKTEIGQFLSSTSKSLAFTSTATGGAVLGLGAGMIALGSFVCWIFELLRRVLLDVAGVFVPLALVGLIWRPTAVWARRVLEVVFAAIISQFLLVTFAVVGLAALAHSGSQDSVSTLFLGGIILTIAGLLPVMAVSAAPMVDARVISSHMDHRAIAGRLPAVSAGSAVAKQAMAGAAAGKPVPTPKPPAPPPPRPVPVSTGGKT